jgi:hypothetical protein
VDAIATIEEASNFLAAGIAVLAASRCHAKITPAALHRGDFAGRNREAVEAAGSNPKFSLSDCRRLRSAAAPSRLKAPPMAPP